MTIYLIK